MNFELFDKLENWCIDQLSDQANGIPPPKTTTAIMVVWLVADIAAMVGLVKLGLWIFK